MANNQITSIENGVFQELTLLRFLNLSGNRIASIENRAFQGLSSLQVLGLHGNQITSLENEDFQGLSNLQGLGLSSNQITSIENGDFQGLGNLQTLVLHGNQITSIDDEDFQGLANLKSLNMSGNRITSLENGAFRGLSKLRTLDLSDNQIAELNLSAATFGSLDACNFTFEGQGFCVDSGEIRDLILDHALLSQSSFGAIVGATQSISNVSLVSLAFSDDNPANLSALLNIKTLDNVRVDHALFNRYAAEFNAFDAIPGNTVTIVPEPKAVVLLLLTLLTLSCRTTIWLV
jgi:carboxypeptidase N regulatory subunit/peroxidase